MRVQGAGVCLLLSSGVVAMGLLGGCAERTAAVPAFAVPAAAASVSKGDPAEGARVARRVGCDGCHSAGGKGGGMDLRSPEGDRIVAPNLTVRRERYDDAGLAALLHEGRTHDGHLPVGMPIFMFQHLSSREVRDITAWLRALPKVDNPDLAESRLTPASAALYRAGTHPYQDDLRPDPGNSPPPDRPAGGVALGRHIALTSCSECHGRDLTGWGEGGPVPSLVLASKAYTPAHFARLMRAGVASTGKDTASGMMSEVARWRFSAMTDAEITALKAYLDSR